MALALIIHWFFQFYTIMIIIAILSSWFRELDQFALIQWMKNMTEPYLAVFRRFIPPLGVIDVSPIIAFFFLRVLESCIMGVLLS